MTESAETFPQYLNRLKLFQSSPALYGGLAGFSEFGTTGTAIKQGVTQVMRKGFEKNEFWEVDFPLITPKIVWEASGHLGKFSDIVAYSGDKIFRVDKVVEADYPQFASRAKSLPTITELLSAEKIIPAGSSEPLRDPQNYSLMVMAKVANEDVVLRPETATTTYLGFADYLTQFRQQLPIRVFQTGKAFRNEVTARQGLIRGREFEQFEGQIFLLGQDRNSYDNFGAHAQSRGLFFDEKTQKANGAPQELTLEEAASQSVLGDKAFASCFGIVQNICNKLGLNNGSIRFRQHFSDEKAHYARDAWDVEFNSPQYGWLEICGVHDRGTYDLQRHSDFSKKNLTVRNSAGEVETPAVLEIAFGVGRTMYATLENSFATRDGKTVLKIPSCVSPIQAGIVPLTKKDGLPEIGLDIHSQLRRNGLRSVYDEKGSVGKRYARFDEVGTPFCYTVDYQTLTDNTVTERDLLTGNQLRVHRDEIYTRVLTAANPTP